MFSPLVYRNERILLGSNTDEKYPIQNNNGKNKSHKTKGPI